MRRGSPEGYMFVSAAARELEVSERTIRTLFDGGALRGTRSAIGYRLIELDSVRSYKPQRHLTVSEAAERLGLSCDQVRARFDQGVLAGHRTPRGHRRIDPNMLMYPCRECRDTVEVVFVSHDQDADGHPQHIYRCRPSGHLTTIVDGEVPPYRVSSSTSNTR